MLTPSGSADAITEGKDNIYRVCFKDSAQGTLSAQYIAENGLPTKVGVIYNNGDAYSTGIATAFVARAQELGMDVVAQVTFPDDTNTDFSTQLNEAKAAGADMMFLPIYYTPASLMLAQAKDMGYAPTFFGADGMDGILGVENFDPALRGEKILLQGVVDCALVEEDGITVVDFKTDRVTEETLDAAARRYAPQVQTYAEALSRIYEMQVKGKYLYFFRLNRFVEI